MKEKDEKKKSDKETNILIAALVASTAVATVYIPKAIKGIVKIVAHI